MLARTTILYVMWLSLSRYSPSLPPLLEHSGRDPRVGTILGEAYHNEFLYDFVYLADNFKVVELDQLYCSPVFVAPVPEPPDRVRMKVTFLQDRVTANHLV